MKVNNSSEFGTAIKNRRKKLGYTQKYISDFTGLSITFISDVENGKKTVEFGKALSLAHILGLDLEIKERG